MKEQLITYREGDDEFEGYAAWDESVSGSRPGIVIAHAWAGQGDAERGKARDLAELGYVGFALDNYGVGKRGKDKDENAALMQPLVEEIGGRPGATSSLSPRERQVLQLIADGFENKQVSFELDLSEATVKTYVRGIFARLDVTSRAEAVAVAMRRGLID